MPVSELNSLLQIDEILGVNTGSKGPTRIVVLDLHFRSSRYERHQNYYELTGNTASLKFHVHDQAAGGAVRAPSQAAYTLYGNGIPVATTNVTATASRFTFNADLTLLPDKS